VEAQKDVIYKLVPTLSSNPTSGTGAGIVGMGIYKADSQSSPSQLLLSAQYTNTDSYNTFLMNKMYFKRDLWQSNSFLGKIFNNSQHPFPADLPVLPPAIDADDGIQYNVEIYVAIQQFLYAFDKNFYSGGQLIYIDQSFSPLNQAGSIFLQAKGIEDSARGGYGLTFIYDSRSQSEKFYATDASWVELNLNQFPEFLGIDNQYYNISLNARKYVHGYKNTDVFAMQLYGQYSSENTPDGALAALGARNIIRGFPIGQYKARFMLATQGEYRYRLDNTPFRLTAFAGYAKLSGGSRGDGAGNNRDQDNGNYYSGGLGLHYILDSKQQLDYRLNISYTSDGETSIYANINQAF